MKKTVLQLALILLAVFTAFGMYKEDPKSPPKPSSIKTNDLMDHFNINELDMLFQNNGIGSYNSTTSGAGLYWPKGTIKTVVFEDGLLLGGKVGPTEEIRVGGSTYYKGLQAGQIIDGAAQNPADVKYKIWKIKRGWESLDDGAEKTRLQYDYENWPIDQGAPFEIDPITNKKIPQFLGDEVD